MSQEPTLRRCWTQNLKPLGFQELFPNTTGSLVQTMGLIIPDPLDQRNARKTQHILETQ